MSGHGDGEPNKALFAKPSRALDLAWATVCWPPSCTRWSKVLLLDILIFILQCRLAACATRATQFSPWLFPVPPSLLGWSLFFQEPMSFLALYHPFNMLPRKSALKVYFFVLYRFVKQLYSIYLLHTQDSN